MIPETLGLAAIVGYLLFLPLTFTPDPAAFCLLLLGIPALLSARGVRPRLTAIDYAVIGIVAFSVVVSSAFSVDPARGFRYSVYLVLNLFMLVLASAMASPRSLRLLAAGVTAVGVIHLLGLLGMMLLANGLDPAAAIRQLHMATLIVPNDAIILSLCWPAVWFFSRGGKGNSSLPGNFLLLAYAGLTLLVAWFLDSKLVALGLVVAMGAVAAVRFIPAQVMAHPTRRLLVFLGAPVALLLLSVAVFYSGNQSTTRLSLWSAALSSHDSVKEVLIGAGPNTFDYIPGQSPGVFDSGNYRVPWVHNAYLEAYYDQGLLGVASLFALTVIPLARATRPGNNAVGALLLASMLTFCALALFEITLTRRFCFAFLAVMYGLVQAQGTRMQT